MAAYDSIVNVEEWISDHFLTTDETKGASFSKRVVECIRDWKKEEDESGHPSPWTRFTGMRGQLETELSLLDEDSSPEDAHVLIRQAFGYGVPELRTLHRAGDTISYQGWAGNAGSMIVIAAESIATPEDLTNTPLIGGVLVKDKQDDTATAAKLVGDLFLSDTPPEFVVVLAGDWVVLAERESWPLGRHLAINLALVVERNETKAKGEMQRAAVALARENIERAADGTTWWSSTIEESREHAVKVSGELRNAVRESIELLGNDVLTRHREQGISIEDIDGNELAKQSLRYLYRILFLLFAEASPELEILPTGTPEYDDGYGLSRLRELILTPPVTQQARSGTHLYGSLQVLFKLVDKGNDPEDPENPDFDPDAGEKGLQFRNLSADLFQSTATALIDRVKLSNATLNQVLENLLLSKQQAGRDRGFISYATLGVTELGQVYEGLMSYTGFIAEEDLFEVAPKGNPEKGSWVLPVAKADTVPQDSFVEEEVEAAEGGTMRQRRRHARGSFVFRQSSRDRERSASFYTPQVLTEFTVGQAIEVLKEEGRITTAEDVLSLTICEPAMGSGAFAVEAVRQLAELYIKLRQQELDQQIPSEDRTKELQKVKAHIALHQVYGVDLNATAVELAEISLWLDTMTADLKAPWFGLHLRRGNSLVGASRSTYALNQLKKKEWLTAVPKRRSLTDIAEAVDAGETGVMLAEGIHHFLLPSNGWGAVADAKDLKDIAAEEQKALKEWRKQIRLMPNKTQTTALQNLARRVETLWRFALIRLRIAEDQARRDIDIWGRENDRTAKNVTREQIEKDLFENLNGAYNRLRLVMDAWCALWFWPLDVVPTEGHSDRTSLPNLDEWLAALRDILGTDVAVKKKDAGQYLINENSSWADLNAAENSDWQFANALSIEKCFNAHPWLETVRGIAEQQGFFHWDLDFGAVFAQGGFDLQVGNPPWVRPRTDLDALSSEVDPWFSLAHKPTQQEKRERREGLRHHVEATQVILRGVGETIAAAAFLGDIATYPHLRGQQPDLYRGFMERTWTIASDTGVISLIHPESHFTEKKAASLRRGAYLRLRRHWQFINELRLFDVHNLVSYGINVYSKPGESVSFLNAASLYHPHTVADSLNHDGSGPLPGLKDDEGNWDRRPHRDRILQVDEHVLKVWKSILEDESTSLLEARMVYTVNTEAAAVLEKLAAAPRVKELGLSFSSGWHESADKKKGYFDVGWGHPASWDDVILQGPHLGVSTPMIKQPNPTMSSNKDWAEIDLEALPEDFIPATAYQPNRDLSENIDYEKDYGTWTTPSGPTPVASTYRIAWREMAATTGFRTVYPSIIPPGSTHVHTVNACSAETAQKTVQLGAVMSSMLSDYFVRSSGSSHIFNDIVRRIPFQIDPKLKKLLERLYLQLNSLTTAYSQLWEMITGEPWTKDVPLRKGIDRRAAQIEIDGIVALSLGVTADELCMIYRTQFPVMRRYDLEDRFDRHGRKVPKEVMVLQKKLQEGQELTQEQRTWIHPQSGVTYLFEYPFQVRDREKDLRTAYLKYEEVLLDN
ncbi:hypothetical protein CFAEC_13455 [Corynebacterium faecale]|uniref:DNA methyltransferase n=1 Tax=Corynebacterium faecale TaxID=1758466 RepID=UPI0025B316C4|nr:DNA methyltransferase [Corynebacterium faecale]WJY93476.1 hypothetical protein CFAEC_13455 [Corynebacterium faecale]